jgi:hypothetical protein
MNFRTYEDRLAYLMLRGDPGDETFGGLRHINQVFYRSTAWRHIRNGVIVRDRGLDLGLEAFPIDGDIFVHHMNPISPNILVHETEFALNPEYLISVSFNTHQIIHYAKQIPVQLVIREREPGDTKLW